MLPVYAHLSYDELTAVWKLRRRKYQHVGRKLNVQKLHSLWAQYSVKCLRRSINNDEVGRHDKCVGEIRNAQKMLVKKLELGVDGRKSLKIHFKKRSVEIWTGLLDQKQRQNRDKTLAVLHFPNKTEFRDDLKNCQFLEKHIQCVPLATEPGISLIILTPIKILQEYVR